MASIEEMILSSTCFGVAWDGTVKECKVCEVRSKCEAKCKGAVPSAESKPESIPFATIEEVSATEEKANEPVKEKAKKPAKVPKAEVNYSPDMPDFKSLTMDELTELLVDRGGNPKDYDRYNNDAIKKMRMIMFLKKTYIVE